MTLPSQHGRKLTDEDKAAIEERLLAKYGGPDWNEAVRKFAHNRGLSERVVIAQVLFLRAQRSAQE